MRALLKWKESNGQDRRLLVKAFGAVLLVRAALIVLPYRTVRAFTGRMGDGRKPPQRPASKEERNRIIWAVNAASRRLLNDRPCLTKALAAHWMLDRTGHVAELCLGARKDVDGTFVAHAWLEQDGEIIIGGRHSSLLYERFKQPAQGESHDAGNPQVDAA